MYNHKSMPNEDQKEYWNDRAGEQWVSHQEALDAMLIPVTQLLMNAVAPQKAERLLDIGCGTGETSLMAANAGATVTGVDISEPMLALAKQRLGDQADMQAADASEWQADEPFDVIMSRFGVMFFDDPVAAFSNICSNLKPGGRMIFACWQAPQENEWVMLPMSAIIPLLPEPPQSDPEAPGPFALADPERLRGILSDAGFDDIQIEPHGVPITLAHEGGLKTAVEFSSQIGPAAKAMAEVDEVTRSKILVALSETLAPHVDGEKLALDGGIFIVRASHAR